MTTPSHETFREQLLDLAYGELDRRAERALRQHLEGCAGCKAELERMTSTRSAMAALSDEPAPERGEAVLLAAAREAARARERKPFAPWWFWRATAGVAVAALLAVVSVRLLEQRAVRGGERSPTDLVASAPEEPAAPQGSMGKPAPAADQPGASADKAPVATSDAEEGRKAKGDAQLKEETPRKADVAQEPTRPLAKAPPPPRAAPGDEKPARERDGLAFHGYTRVGPGLAGRTQGGKDAGGELAQGGLELDEKAKDGAADRFAEAPAPAAEPAPAAPSRAAPPPPATSAPAAEARPAAKARLDDSEMEFKRDRAETADDAPARRRAAVASAAGPATAAAPAPEDPVAREARLRAAGRLRVETRTFAGCPGEAERTVELDEGGTAVKVTRRGTYQGKPYVAELYYAEGGALGAVRWSSEGRVQEFRADPPGASISAAGIPGAIFHPQRAADAGPDAPANCRF